MTAKEFFRQVRRAERELKIIKAKLEHYEDLGFSLGGAVGVIGNKQRGSSRVEMAAIGKVDVLRDLVDQQREYHQTGAAGKVQADPDIHVFAWQISEMDI